MRIRTVLAVACSIVAAAALGVLPAAGAASAARAASAAGGARAAGAAGPTGASSTGAGATETTPACGTVPAGYATCLAWVRHKAGGQASSSPTGYAPATIEKAYGFASSDKGTGTGRTISLVDAYDDPKIATDLETFSKEYGLPTCTTANGCFEKVNQTGGTSYPAETAGWDVEISLDVEWAHAIAPKAHILLVEATSNSYTNLFDAVSYAAAHATYVSMSWGGTEFTGEKTFDKDFSPSGVSFFAAAGDKKSEVIYPSASPDVISVGGTTLTVTSTGAWKSESAWSTGGGGCSAVETANPSQSAYASYDQTDATCKGKRATPDVALDANPSTGVSVYDSIRTPEFGSGWEKVGGTSVATPIWAAHSAAAGDLVDAAFVYGSNIRFYDVTSGSNGHTCVAGYNLCDGLGSCNTSVGTLNTAPIGSLSISTSTPSGYTLSAGTSLDLSVSLSATPSSPVPVTLTSSSGSGSFWTTTATTHEKSLTVTVSAPSTGAAFHYSDTVAGSPTLTASSPGWTTGTRSVTVTAGALAAITVSPATVSLGAKSTQTFTATGTDQYGNTVPASTFDPSWTTSVPGGTLGSTSGDTTVLTAGSTAGSGTVTATATSDGKPVSGRATVTVTSTPTLAVSVTAGSVTERGRTYEVPLSVQVTGTSGGVKGAKVSMDVYGATCSGSLAASGSGTTGSSGAASFTFSTTSTGTYCAKATATASGYDAGSGTVSFGITASTRGVRGVRP